MKYLTLAAFICVVAVAVFAMGCMDREPAPVCPVPLEIASTGEKVTGFDGVDLLVMVDNSLSMEAEQQILSTGFYTLINSLVNPIISNDWTFPEVENVRVAVITSDMGLQYGDNGSDDGFPYGLQVSGCTEAGSSKGDDGRFMGYKKNTINPESGKISCEDEGGQCPADWNCNNKGKCIAPDATTTNCPDMSGNSTWAETTEDQKNAKLATQVACLAQQGTKGCGIEQQLEAPVRALSRTNQKEFLKESHLLAVLIVSDEEDCSVQKKGLFQTDEFKSGAGSDGLLNTGCNLPKSNESDFLFDTSRYWAKLVELKGNQAQAVIFAAIVGVPTGGKCEGTGDTLEGCLDVPKMELKIQEFEDTSGRKFKHFAPACDRYDEDEVEVTSARPGRRYVKVAQNFGASGYIYSICNEDWSPAMKEIARVIAENIGTTCYSKQLDWVLLPAGEKKDCDKCGEAKCDVVVNFDRVGATLNDDCPGAFNVDKDKVTESIVRDDKGEIMRRIVSCPLPKLAAPLDCDAAHAKYGGQKDTVGWYYCETRGLENFDDACGDKMDNDDDGKADCDDSECQACPSCDGNGVGCEQGCRYGVEITEKGKKLAQGALVAVQCLQQFVFEDKNCQENTQESCRNDEDDDGNGVWDCDDTLDNAKAADPHRPDPKCCPMTKKSNQKCDIDTAATKRNCGKALPDACYAHAELLGCIMP